MMLSRNISVRPMCQYNNKQPAPIQTTSVFQLDNFSSTKFISITLCEIYDMIDVSIPFNKSDKNDFFGSFGLDYDKVVKHIDTVAYLERCWNAPTYNR